MEYDTLPVTSRVRVVSYGPFRGLKGTVRRVDRMPYQDDPFYFYHIELEGAYVKEAIWFEYEEVELVGAPDTISISAMSG